jgi:hypothetical protein
MQVNDGISDAAGANRQARQIGAAMTTTAGSVDEDGYMTGAITSTQAGINKTDPNYSSMEIGIEDF